jgi:hypothetical protein
LYCHDLYKLCTPELGRPGTVPSQGKIRQYRSGLEKWAGLLRKYGDEESSAHLQQCQERLQGLLEGLGLNQDGENVKSESHKSNFTISNDFSEFPLALRQALVLLASEQRVTQLMNELLDTVRTITDDIEDLPAFDFESDIPIDWTEGTEDINDLTLNDIHKRLGITELPWFNNRIDPFGLRNPWKAEDEEWLRDDNNTVELQARWHQWLGILRLIERFWQGKNMLLMDEVGLGKTLQVVGALTILAYFREFYEEKGRFPGAFGKLFVRLCSCITELCAIANTLFQGKQGNIPDEAFIIVCPVTLLTQLTSELHRYLQPGSFDILPYTGKHRTRQTWWTDIWGRCNHKEGRRIVIATTTVSVGSFCCDNINNALTLVSQSLQSDFDTTHHMLTAKTATSDLSVRNNRALPTTIYGRKWTAAFIDEAHNCRNINKAYCAGRALREHARMFVAMTATPVTTRPMVCDISSMKPNLTERLYTFRTCGTSGGCWVCRNLGRTPMRKLPTWNANSLRRRDTIVRLDRTPISTPPSFGRSWAGR